MRLFTLALCLSLASLCSRANAQAHLDTARVYIGVQEFGNNAGPDIERFLASVGLRKGNPYCAAFVSFCLNQAGGIEFPTIRTALASRFITRGSIKASSVLRGVHPLPGSIVIWKKGNTIFGHAGLVLDWSGKCGQTIEANTSSGVYGSQRDGDGVWIRERCITPGSYFRIVSFTPVRYVQK